MLLFLTTNGINVNLNNFRLILKLHDECIGEVLLDDLDCIMSFGGINFTTPVLKSLLKHNIPIYFFSEYGKYLGNLSSPVNTHGILRYNQYNVSYDNKKRLILSKAFVYGKANNQLSVLQQKKWYNNVKELNKNISKIQKFIKKISQATSLNELRGIEGIISKIYFNSFPLIIHNKSFSFDGRSKYPPQDSVNAMLSMGYSILSSVIHGFIESAKLDPCIGFLHSSNNEKPSLVFDMMEEWRFIIDMLTIKLINLNIVKVEYFEKIDKVTYLADIGLKTFLNYIKKLFTKTFYYKRLNKKMNIMSIMQEQIYYIARAINNEKITYSPFIF